MNEELHELLSAHLKSMQDNLDNEYTCKQIGDINLANMHREQTILHLEQFVTTLKILGDYDETISV